jgi:hypothetical protein
VRSISKSSPSAFSSLGSPVRVTTILYFPNLFPQVPDEYLPDVPSPSFKKRNPDSPLTSSSMTLYVFFSEAFLGLLFTESGSESPRKRQRNRLSQTMDSLREEQMELDNAAMKKGSTATMNVVCNCRYSR